MKEARYLHASVGLDGFLYVIGGHNGEHRLKSIEKYNPDTNTWADFKPMLKALSSPSAVACEGQIYILGELNSLEYFDSYRHLKYKNYLKTAKEALTLN